MFHFHEETPKYEHFLFQLGDAFSGLLFGLVAVWAYIAQLYILTPIYLAVATTSIIHVYFPNKLLRLLDYSLAVTCVLICLILIVLSNFIYPHTLLAALFCGSSLTIYALYQKRRLQGNHHFLYYFWHMGAMGTSLACITAYAVSIGVTF